MSILNPRRPGQLNIYAAELLDKLRGHPECAAIVLGGGVALSHYVDYRTTVDLDAWWRAGPDAAARERLRAVIKGMALAHGLDYRERMFGETESYELLCGPRKVFACQISSRTLYLDEAGLSDWQPVGLETLRDNVGSKMLALAACRTYTHSVRSLENLGIINQIG